MNPRRPVTLLMTSLMLMAAVHPVLGDVNLSLSSPDDLNDLFVGDSVQVEIALSGLEPPQIVVTLAVDVLIDDTVFGPPIQLQAGPIVPQQADNFDDSSLADPDLVTGAFFLDTGSVGITSNGLFFSFTLPVVGTGSGTIGFDPGSALALADDDSLLDITEGDPIDFVAQVPEPSTTIIVGLGLIGWMGRRRCGCGLTSLSR